jgi:two-component system response regulator FlrC
VISLTLPPLRQRKDDIVLLARHFMEKYSRLNRKNVVGLGEAAVEMLLKHSWNGNVRELENTIERAVLISSGEHILPENLLMEPSESGAQAPAEPDLKVGITVRDMEKDLIFRTLEKVNDNRTHAADLLGISIRTLRNKLREYKEETEAQNA